MDKRGSSILMMIFEVLAVLLVLYITISIAHAYGSSDTVLRINAAEDTRMMVDALVGSPGDSVVRYPHNVSAFSFILGQERIAVFKQGELENKWVQRRFFLPNGTVAEGSLQEKTGLCLEKKAKKIILRECGPNE